MIFTKLNDKTVSLQCVGCLEAFNVSRDNFSLITDTLCISNQTFYCPFCNTVVDVDERIYPIGGYAPVASKQVQAKNKKQTSSKDTYKPIVLKESQSRIVEERVRGFNEQSLSELCRAIEKDRMTGETISHISYSTINVGSVTNSINFFGIPVTKESYVFSAIVVYKSER